MGRVFSSLVREFKNYDIEARAHKAISQEVRPSSKKYESTFKEMKAAKDRGIALEDMAKKDETLDANLKNIYVLSGGEQAETERPDRQLPVDRIKDWSDLGYGYVEPKELPPGKVSVKTTLELLSRHNEDSSVWTTEKLASHFKISNKLVEQLVDRYQVFQLHLPDESEMKSKKMSLESRVQLQRALHSIREITLIADKEKNSKSTPMPEIKAT